MEELKFKISETSLRYGIYNNYKKGHTASVETEINQSKNPKKWRNDILQLRNMNCRLEENEIPDGLIEECKKNEKNKTNVTDVFVFDNILVNGEELDVDTSYCMYIKEEISETANVINATHNNNTHLGRLMIHYPISFDYRKDGLNISNRSILEKIMEENGDYAFVVNGFVYYPETHTLNFLVKLVGPRGILQTSVFKEGKGIGQKLKIDDSFSYEDNNIVICRPNIITGKNDVEIEEVNRTRSSNGLKGEEFVFELLNSELEEENDLFHTSKTYKFSPYDIEYVKNGIKKYIEVKATQSDREIFNLSAGELKFMKQHKENYVLYMVTNVNSEFPKYKIYTFKDIKNMKMDPVSFRVTPLNNKKVKAIKNREKDEEITYPISEEEGDSIMKAADPTINYDYEEN